MIFITALVLIFILRLRFPKGKSVAAIITSYAFVGFSLLASVFTVTFSSSSDHFLIHVECLKGVEFCAWTHFFAFMECADEISSWPATCNYIPV